MRFAIELVACTLFYLLGVRSGTGRLKTKLNNWLRNRNIEWSHGVTTTEAILQSLADKLRE